MRKRGEATALSVEEDSPGCSNREDERDGNVGPRKLLEQDQEPHVRHAGACGCSSDISSIYSWQQLNNIVILGFPLGFYMAAQGSLIVFVVMLFWFARKQNAHRRRMRRGGRLSGGNVMATTATSGRRRFHLQSRPHLRHLYRRLHRLHHPDGDPRARSACPNVIIGYLFVGFTIVDLRRHRHLSAHHAGRRILCRRPPRAGVLQRHGDRRRLDVGGIVHRHGRHALPARL